jgi:hypothetical protein
MNAASVDPQVGSDMSETANWSIVLILREQTWRYLNTNREHMAVP